MLKKFYLSIFLALIGIPALVLSQSIAPQIQFDEIPLGHFNRLLESIVAHKEQFELGDVPDRPVVTGALWSGFEHNLTNISADIDSISLRFIDSRAAKGNNDTARAPSFDIQIIFEDSSFIAERMAMFSPLQKFHASGAESSRVVIKHSRAAAQAEMNGIRLAISPEHQTRLYINGLDRTGVAIFIPKIPRTGFAARGLVICPREFDIWKAKRGQRKLQNSDYTLLSAIFQAQAKVEAKVNTGLGAGYAATTIQTSANILPSQHVIDQSVAKHPYSAVDYRPVNQPISPATFVSENITAGIRATAIHHNSFQHKTVSVADVVIGIRNVDLQSALTFKYAEAAYAIQTGSCVAVLKEIKMRQTNTKEALPKEAQVAPQAEPSAETQRPGEHLFDLDESSPLDDRRSPLEDLLEAS